MSFNENPNRPTDARKLVTFLENERKNAAATIVEIEELVEPRYTKDAKECLQRVQDDIKHVKETISRLLDTTSSTQSSTFDPIVLIRESFDNGIWNLNAAYGKLTLACYNTRFFDVDEDTEKVLTALKLDTEKVPVLKTEIVRLTKMKFYLQSFDIDTIKKAEE